MKHLLHVSIGTQVYDPYLGYGEITHVNRKQITIKYKDQIQRIDTSKIKREIAVKEAAKKRDQFLYELAKKKAIEEWDNLITSGKNYFQSDKKFY